MPDKGEARERVRVEGGIVDFAEVAVPWLYVHARDGHATAARIRENHADVAEIAFLNMFFNGCSSAWSS